MYFIYQQFTDKLEGMLETLTTTAEQVENAEPISAHPDKLHDQIADNKAIIEDMEKKLASLEGVREMAEDLIAQHGVEEGDAQGLWALIVKYVLLTCVSQRPLFRLSF